MRPLTWIWAHRISCLKVVGLALLAAYFLQNPLGIEPIWIAAYLAIVVSVGVGCVIAVYPLIDRLFPGQKADVDPIAARLFSEARRRPLLHALLLPGEDGFFLVPLLWVGITPVTAAIAAAAFAAAHYPQFRARDCVAKFAFLFCVAFFVLPNGLGSVVVGHLILDTVAVIVGAKLFVDTPATGRGDG